MTCMATAPPTDDSGSLFNQFLARKGHEPVETWDRDYNKKQCPECGGLHEITASDCTVCGWVPTA